MFNPKMYRDICSELCIPDEKIEEVISMVHSQNTRRPHRPLRLGLVAAVVSALLVVSVSAAGIPAVHDFILSISASVDALHIPQVTLTQENGRTLLCVDGTQTDITDALTREGAYTQRQTGRDGSGYEIRVAADGSYTLTGYDGQGNEIYTSVASAGENTLTCKVTTEDEAAAGTKGQDAITVTVTDAVPAAPQD